MKKVPSYLFLVICLLTYSCGKEKTGDWHCSRYITGEGFSQGGIEIPAGTLQEQVFEPWETQQVTAWHSPCGTWDNVTDCKCEQRYKCNC